MKHFPILLTLAFVALTLGGGTLADAQTAPPVLPKGTAEEVDFADLDADGSCGKTLHLTRGQVHEILDGPETYTVQLHGSREPVVIASVPSPYLGILMFRQVAGHWRPTFLVQGSTVQAVLVTPDDSRVFIVSLWSREGGGPLGVSSYNGRDGSIACVELTMPRDLNQPLFAGEYASFERLEMDLQGAGQLLASAATEPDSASHGRVYAYRTQNFGRKWTLPRRLKQLPPARHALSPMTRPGLEASLRARMEADADR